MAAFIAVGIERVYAGDPTPQERAEFLRLYIDKNRLATDYLFNNREEFLRLVYECGSSVEIILWFEHISGHKHRFSLGSGGCRDPLNSSWICAETPISEEGLSEKNFKEVIDRIRGVVYEHPGHEMMPAFYLRKEEK